MTEEIIDNFEKELASLSAKEIVAWKNFEASYKVIYPPPVEPNTINSILRDWKFITSIITALSGSILAGFRTYGAFYLAAVYNLNSFGSIAEALSAVFAIEGSVVLFSIRKARTDGRTDDNIWFGLAIAFVISILAGLSQSVNILDVKSYDAVNPILKGTLVIAMGIGATVIAGLSGHTLGVDWVRFDNERKSEKDQYQKSLNGYRSNMIKNWRTSYELNAVNERKNVRYRSESDERSREHRSDEPVRSERSRTNNGGASSDDITDILDTVFAGEGRVAGVSEIARKIASSRSETNSDADFSRYKGIASETRRRWMISKGIIDEQGNVLEKGIQ